MNVPRMQKSVAKIVADNGESVQWAQTGVTVPDNTMPWKNTAGATTSIAVNVFFRRAGNNALSALIHFATKDTDVPQNAVSAILPGISGVVPKLTDTVTRANGDVYIVDSIDILGPSTNVIAYLVTFNRGN